MQGDYRKDNKDNKALRSVIFITKFTKMSIDVCRVSLLTTS